MFPVRLILFLFATLVFSLATPLRGSDLVQDETTAVVKPPGETITIVNLEQNADPHVSGTSMVIKQSFTQSRAYVVSQPLIIWPGSEAIMLKEKIQNYAERTSINNLDKTLLTATLHYSFTGYSMAY